MPRNMTVLLLILLLVSASTTGAQDDNPLDGLTLTVPQNAEGPLPLVVVLHGRHMTGAQMQALTRFDALAGAEGVIVAYPDGVDGMWNSAAGIPYFEPSERDDVGRLRELVALIGDVHPVDPERVYAVGFSNGGYMAQRLACDAPQTFAAFAVVGAGGLAGLDEVCAPEGVAPMLLIHGLDDAIVPWDGIRVSVDDEVFTLYWSVSQTVAFWAGYNGCENVELTEMEKQVPNDPTRVFRMRYTCPTGTDVQLYGVVGGGHNWPGSPGLLSSEVAGNVSSEIDATQVIWGFLEQFGREDAAD